MAAGAGEKFGVERTDAFHSRVFLEDFGDSVDGIILAILVIPNGGPEYLYHRVIRLNLCAFVEFFESFFMLAPIKKYPGSIVRCDGAAGGIEPRELFKCL